VAEIRVERKQRSVWPWILGLLLLVLLALGLMAMLGNRHDVDNRTSAEVGAMREEPATMPHAYPVADLRDAGPAVAAPVDAAA
jgi:hypothetical protein